MVIVPDRLLPVEFDPTLNATVPLPVPAAPAVMVIHVVVVVAVHAQPVFAVTATEPGPPPAAMDVLCGLIEYVQVGGGGAAAAWFTVKVLPAIVMVPLRAEPVFAATV